MENILQIDQVLDIGNMGKQRLLFRVLKNGNLIGHHLFQGDSYLYTFPSLNVKKDHLVVLYIDKGETETREYPDAVCHFLFLGERIRFWEEQAEGFRLVFRNI